MQTGVDFRWRCGPLWTGMLLIVLVMMSTGRASVFTSTEKIQTMADQEGLLLEILETYLSADAYVNEEYDALENLSTVFSVRSKAFYSASAEERRNVAQHPNGAYYIIKHFSTTWANVLQKSPALSSKLGSVLDSLPQTIDYQGALRAIVRLQRVYQLQVSDIYIGNYLGYMGPALGPHDALEVGRQAFVDGFVEESIQWLELAADKLQRQEQEADTTHNSRSSLAKAISFLVRAYIVAELHPYHVCRYKPSVYVPYVRYQEEILSISPYVSVFYNFVSDSEIDAFKSFVQNGMETYVSENLNKTLFRVCDIAWIHDFNVELAGAISQRVKDATWLDVAHGLPHGRFSSEAYQIVNYGLGGHYYPHLDPINPTSNPVLVKSGDRLATFLIYLSDVEKGGNTAFLKPGISVAAQKGMALFWYNYNPAMKKDRQVRHAGCPVVIGNKWIATKWIWTHGNMFRRPCGPHPDSTQLDIERLMASYVRRT